MLVTRQAFRGAAATLCAAALAAGCSSGGDDNPAPKGGVISAATMRAALLQGKDVGPTWKAPDASAAPPQLVSLCGADNPAPPLPGSPQEVVTAPLVDEGTAGAQALTQTALVYPDAAAAQAAQFALKVVAEACPPTIDMAARDTGEAQEPAYTETVSTTPLTRGEWSGFVVLRHKQYEPKHPSTADTAVAVLVKRNVLLFDAYAIYRLNNSSQSPQFTSDWQKLVGSVISRVDGQPASG
ncbi:hypothetical protein EV385_0034 [Krasilnikovia cinnamomea]|uniref:PknH-like protein n=1 Tax=Krasilnikovia cinnamomea TaxID=349313 RepID=A0A4Q7ZDN3_9ACTN|nr:hypothetical protein [Krasilnikovia cinnamomea]RZU48321.1 hypothetical protein EV385_0034 [Krasilnikovia cinnamomea]